jgi:hypothetical protein
VIRTRRNQRFSLMESRDLYEHGLSSGRLIRIHPSGRNEFRPPSMHPNFPVGLMNHPMMSATQHHEIFDIRLAAIDPFTDMMHLAPGGFAVTPRMCAPPIARGDRFALRQAHTAALPAEVEGLAGAVEHHRVTPQSHNNARKSAAVPRPPKSNINPRDCSRIHW